MTLLQIATLACQTIKKTDTYSMTLCKTYVMKNYQMIWEKFTWVDSQTTVVQSLGSGTSTLAVNSNVELVMMVVWDSYPLRNSDIVSLYRMRPDWTTQTGSPRFYINLPKSNGQCNIQLDSLPTLTKNVTIVGKSVFVPLVNDSDVPILRGIDNALIALSEGDMMCYINQVGSANSYYTKGQAMVQEMIDLETKQQTQLFQMMPVKMDWDLNDLVTTTQGINNDTYFLRGS